MTDIELQFERTPSAFAYMSRAFVPKGGGHRLPPAMSATWRNAAIAELLPPGAGMIGREHIHPIYLHGAGLRLMMSVVTHPRFPVRIWNILQVRNRIVQHHAIALAVRPRLVARITESRVMPKGIEVDVAVTVSEADQISMESVTTFYIRGRFPGAAGALPPPAPAAPTERLATWSVSSVGARAFARLTGDYNGIHWMNAYARAFGFQGAFAHPHRVLAQVFDRLPQADPLAPFELDVWFKGPVYYERALELSAQDGVFALRVQGDERPAMVGVLRR